MNKIQNHFFIFLIILLIAACAKKSATEGNIKGLAKFQLSGGAASSQPGVDNYNPQVLQQGDNFLVRQEHLTNP